MKPFKAYRPCSNPIDHFKGYKKSCMTSGCSNSARCCPFSFMLNKTRVLIPALTLVVLLCFYFFLPCFVLTILLSCAAWSRSSTDTYPNKHIGIIIVISLNTKHQRILFWSCFSFCKEHVCVLTDIDTRMNAQIFE